MARRFRLSAVWQAALYYMRKNRQERQGGGNDVPATAMQMEDGSPMLMEDGSYMLIES